MKILGKWAEFTQGTWCSLSPHLKLWNQDGDSCPPFLKSSSNMDVFDFSLCHFFSNLHKYKYATSFSNSCVRGSTWREKVTLAFSNTTWVRWLNKVPLQCLTLSIQKLQKYLRFCIGAPGQRNTEYWYRVFKVTAAPTSSAGWITWFAWSTASNIKWFNDDDIITWYDGHYNGSLPIPIVHFFNMVKVSWQSDAWKCQDQFTLLTLTLLSERYQPLCKRIFKIVTSVIKVITCICQSSCMYFSPLCQSNQAKFDRDLEAWWSLILLLLLNWSDSSCWKFQLCNVLVWFGYQIHVWQFTTGFKSKYWQDYVIMKKKVWTKVFHWVEHSIKWKHPTPRCVVPLTMFCDSCLSIVF